MTSKQDVTLIILNAILSVPNVYHPQASKALFSSELEHVLHQLISNITIKHRDNIIIRMISCTPIIETEKFLTADRP
jgi:hypothetical protein